MTRPVDSAAIVSRAEALDIKRPDPPQPFVWPDPVLVMVSDTYKFGLSGRHFNGDPIVFAIALGMLTSLYDQGYALARVPA